MVPHVNSIQVATQNLGLTKLKNPAGRAFFAMELKKKKPNWAYKSKIWALDVMNGPRGRFEPGPVHIVCRESKYRFEVNNTLDDTIQYAKILMGITPAPCTPLSAQASVLLQAIFIQTRAITRTLNVEMLTRVTNFHWFSQKLSIRIIK